jgi:hypothetical protein
MRWEYLLTGLALLLLIVATTVTAATVWGYDLPYSYAYGAGVPFYVGHNNGAPSGEIYENPALYPDGIARPDVIYGQPENALDLNFSHAYPNVAGLAYNSGLSPFKFVDL